MRSTSAASAFSGERYTTLHPPSASAAVRIINLSRHHRNAVSVLPVPVGANINVDSPRAIAGHPSTCGAVGASNTARNHFAVIGWNSPSTSSPLSFAGNKASGLSGAIFLFELEGLLVFDGIVQVCAFSSINAAHYWMRA